MESLLVLAVIVVLFLPIVAILIATSIQREMRRRMEQLEAESRDLRLDVLSGSGHCAREDDDSVWRQLNVHRRRPSAHSRPC